MTRRPPPKPKDFALSRDSTAVERALLFQHMIKGIENQPQNIRMIEAGKAWELACAASLSSKI